MWKKLLQNKGEHAVFICAINEATLQIVKFISPGRFRKEVANLQELSLPPDKDAKLISQIISQAFRKLDYKNQPIIICLPRYLATCRLLKIPSAIPSEVERIASLQAPRYLPYAAQELVSASQVIDVDKAGYSHANLIIAHKDVINRSIAYFADLKPKKISVYLSSYGLLNLYNQLKAADAKPVIFIDANAQEAELAIIEKRKLLYSRAFKFSFAEVNWDKLFSAEVNKTLGVYSRELARHPPEKIYLCANTKTTEGFLRVLKENLDLPLEIVRLPEKIKFSPLALSALEGLQDSFATLAGLGIDEPPDSLNLLPFSLKEKRRGLTRKREYLKLGLLILSIIIIWIIGLNKTIDNKAGYVGRLKTELAKIAREARPLEETEKRLKFMETRQQKKASCLDIVYELHQIIPDGVSLVNLNFDEDKEIVLRGQSGELNSLFEFMQRLEKSSVFKKFNCKIRYATQKKTPTGEFVDFEISCSGR